MEHAGFSVQNLSFKFCKQNEPFFNSLSFFLDAGKIHFLHGRNGSGKSTLFRLLDGSIDRSEYISGTYLLNGIPYRIKNNIIPHNYIVHVKHVVQQIQMMLVEQMTVGENIILTSLGKYPLFKKVSMQKSIDPFLQAVGIAYDQPVYTLSGGQKQLLALIMCTGNTGQLLLLDEPTAALDDRNTSMLMSNIQKLAKERNLVVIVICHDSEVTSIYRTGKLITIAKKIGILQRTVIVE